MVRYRYGIENGAGREREGDGKGTGREWEWNGLDGRADPNDIRADIKTDAKERGKVRDPEEKIKKNANFKEKIWRNQYFFVTLHDNKKKLIPGISLNGKKLTPNLSLNGKKPTPDPSLKGRERRRGRRREKGTGKGQGKEKGLGNEK